MAATKRKTTKLVIPENIVFETPKYRFSEWDKKIENVKEITFERSYGYEGKEQIKYRFMDKDGKCVNYSDSSNPEMYKDSIIFTSLRDTIEEVKREILEKYVNKINEIKIQIIQRTKDLANLEAELAEKTAEYQIMLERYK